MMPITPQRGPGTPRGIGGERPLSGVNPLTAPSTKVKDILEGTLRNTSNTEDYTEFENRISNYRKRILEKAYNKTGIKGHRIWFKEHIEMLQGIYMKLFPDYKETLSWYCLIQTKPDNYDIIKYLDFPGEYSLENFLNKFNTELDSLPDFK